MKSNSRFIQISGFKGGHQYFRDLETGQLALADESGEFPDLTEDGVLYIDFTRKAGHYRRDDGGTSYLIPCIKENHWLQGMDDQGIFPQGADSLACGGLEFEWLMTQGMQLREDVPSPEPLPRLYCSRCVDIPTQKFVGNQRCYVDVIVDSNGEWISNADEKMENCVHDAEDPYGPFSCWNCGKEIEENSNP